MSSLSFVEDSSDSQVEWDNWDALPPLPLRDLPPSASATRGMALDAANHSPVMSSSPRHQSDSTTVNMEINSPQELCRS